LIVPVALPEVKVSFQTTDEVRAPLPWTVPVPILVAAKDVAVVTIIPAAITPERSFFEIECIFVLVKNYNAKVY
jgi:hypothetical protein